MSLEIHAERTAYANTIELRMFDRARGEHGAVVEPLTMRTIDQPGAYIAPTLSMDFTLAQQFVDELWRCGIRPSEGSGSAGSLAATERHLEDMRTVAFASLHKVGLHVAVPGMEVDRER